MKITKDIKADGNDDIFIATIVLWDSFGVTQDT